MMTAGQLWESGCNVLGLYANDAKDLVKNTLNRRYMHMARAMDWAALRAIQSLTFTGSDDESFRLHPGLVNILGVISDDYTYYPTERMLAKRADGKRHWYYRDTSSTPVETGLKTLTSSPGSTTILGPTADRTGDFIRLGSEPGFYEITAYADPNTTIDPAYNGAPITNGDFVIRPPETKTLSILDEVGDHTSDIVSVFYWKTPQPLYLESDLAMIDGRVLELALWIDLVGPNQKRQREALQYKAELDEAMSDAMAQNPKFIMPNMPRSRTGAQLFFGRSR